MTKEEITASLVKKHKIAQLEAVDALHEMYDLLAPKWVSVEELPKHNKPLLVMLPDGLYEVAECHEGRWYTHSEELKCVTHYKEIKP